MPWIVVDGGAINLTSAVPYATLRAILFEGQRTALPAGVTAKVTGGITQWIEFSAPATDDGGVVTVNPATVSQLRP